MFTESMVQICSEQGSVMDWMRVNNLKLQMSVSVVDFSDQGVGIHPIMDESVLFFKEQVNSLNCSQLLGPALTLDCQMTFVIYKAPFASITPPG